MFAEFGNILHGSQVPTILSNYGRDFSLSAAWCIPQPTDHKTNVGACVNGIRFILEHVYLGIHTRVNTSHPSSLGSASSPTESLACASLFLPFVSFHYPFSLTEYKKWRGICTILFTVIFQYVNRPDVLRTWCVYYSNGWTCRQCDSVIMCTYWHNYRIWCVYCTDSLIIIMLVPQCDQWLHICLVDCETL